MQKEEQIIYVKVEELKLNPKNPRQNDKAVDAVAKSIERFGFRNPLLIDKDKMVWCGNTRLKASIKLGLEEVPCLDISDLSEKEIRALALADNKTNEIADWDEELLQEELNDLIDEFDMADFGFADDLEQLLDEKEAEEDNYEIPEEIEPRVKFGDVWQLGEHRLMCGDSTNLSDIEKLIDGYNINLVYTDAPYGISIVNNKGKVGAENLAKNRTYLEVKGDDTTDTAKEFYYNCLALNIDRFILWGGNYFTDFLPFSPSWLIWDKRVDMNSNNFADGEMAWCSFKTPVRIYHQLWNGMIREGEHEDRIHPTQKPIRMQTEILNDFSNENDNILDGFGGSGSTLISCEKTNRNCFMIEYEPKYVDLIIARWEKLTGKKAVKIND